MDFFRQLGFDFVLGKREGAYIWDADGHKRLYNLHCNGGVFNFGHKNPLMVIEFPSSENPIVASVLAGAIPPEPYQLSKRYFLSFFFFFFSRSMLYVTHFQKL